MTPLNTIIEEEKVEFIEKGAELEHIRWSNWQKHCHKVLRENCPSPELEKVLERWDRQIATPYSELSEEEKESDRREVRSYEDLLTSAMQRAYEAGKEERDTYWKERVRKEVEKWADQYTNPSISAIEKAYKRAELVTQIKTELLQALDNLK